MVDEEHAEPAAPALGRAWASNVTLKVIDCPDRRLTRAAQELVDRGQRRGGHRRHGAAAAPHVRPAAGPAAARPHGGPDRERDQPAAAGGRHDRPLRRAVPDQGRVPEHARGAGHRGVRAAAEPGRPATRPRRWTSTTSQRRRRTRCRSASVLPGQIATVVGRLHELDTQHPPRPDRCLVGEVGGRHRHHGRGVPPATTTTSQPGQELRLTGRVQLDEDTHDVLMVDPSTRSSAGRPSDGATNPESDRYRVTADRAMVPHKAELVRCQVVTALVGAPGETFFRRCRQCRLLC